MFIIYQHTRSGAFRYVKQTTDWWITFDRGAELFGEFVSVWIVPGTMEE